MSDVFGIAAAKKAAGSMPLARRELQRLPEFLAEGEQVLALASGRYDGGDGLVAATDRRLLVIVAGIMRSKTEDLPYSKISSVDYKAGIMNGTMTVSASGVRIEVEKMFASKGKEFVDLVRGKLMGGPAAASAPIGGDAMTQLKQLGELRDAGVVTEAEFNTTKAELLTRLKHEQVPRR